MDSSMARNRSPLDNWGRAVSPPFPYFEDKDEGRLARPGFRMETRPK